MQTPVSELIQSLYLAWLFESNIIIFTTEHANKGRLICTYDNENLKVTELLTKVKNAYLIPYWQINM